MSAEPLGPPAPAPACSALRIPVTGPLEYVECRTQRGMVGVLGVEHGERVRIHDGWALLVDEDGRLKRTEPNPRASVLYGVIRHRTPITGPVLLMREGQMGPPDFGVDWLLTGEEELREWYDEQLRERAGMNDVETPNARVNALWQALKAADAGQEVPSW